MTPVIRPLAEVNQQATDILVREIGVVDTLRFLSQFQTGSGNYTKERAQLFDNLSLDEIATEIKAKRKR
ncbi:MAG TPA: hypothetical protein VGY55_19960 [Pirellulales bacterium]|jgi:hypothetical protein|nr:hypothetical protein [Pirellulales bacterium]